MLPNWSLYQTKTEIAYLGKQISDTFRAINRGYDPRNEICNNPIGLVILSAYNRVYLKVEDYKTKNKTHANTELNDRIWQQP